MKRISVLLLAIAMSALLGCGESDRAGADAALSWDKTLADRAQLVDRLPDDAQSYLRLPTLWNLLTAPKDTALAPALATEANQQAVAAMQQALGSLLKDELNDDLSGAGRIVSLLLEGMRAPLELVVLGEADNPMTARFVLGTRLNFDSVDAFEAELSAIAGQFAMARVAASADGDKPGHFLVGPVSMYYQFDAGSGRLLAVAGLQVTAEQLQAVRDWQPNADHPALSVEQRMDADRQGLFNWINGDWIRFGIEQGASGDELAMMEQIGVLGIQHAAVGYGVSAGRGRLSAELAGSNGPLWDLSLPSMPAPDVQLAGDPRWVVGMRLPGLDWWRQASVQMQQAEAFDEAVAEINQGLSEYTDLDLASMAALLDGRYFFVNDANGFYLVHDDIDVAQWRASIEQLSARYELPYSVSDVARISLHHLMLPGLAAENGESLAGLMDVDPALQALMTMSMQVGTHLYWVEESDQVVLAQVPQVLMDRQRYPGEQSLQAWTDGTAEDGDRAWLRAASQTRDTARSNYYSYLGTLQAADDVLDMGLDLTQFPSARELDLEAHGVIAARLDYAGGRIAASLSFDHHPGDMLSGQGAIAGIAVAGILAAIAVPAYQDYVTRAAVSEKLYGASEYKQTIAEFAAREGRLPSVAEGKALGLPGRPGEAIYYDGDTARLVIRIDDVDQVATDAEIWLTARLDETGGLDWQCEGVDVAEKALPARCR